MVDQDLTQLTAITSPLSTDIGYTVSDPAVTKLPRKVTWANILALFSGLAETITGIKTFGSAGNVGKLKIAGTTSGAVTLDATAIAGTGVLTLPNATDTLVGKATADILTNKTFDANGTGNALSNVENADIAAAASIDFSKLAALTSGNILAGSAGNVATSVTMSGDATIIASGALSLAASVNAKGIQDIFIPASAMWARTTTGAGGLTKVESATSLTNYHVWEFDTATAEFVQFSWVAPRNYNNSTVKATFWWTAAVGTAAQTINWTIAGVALRNDDPFTTAFGSAITTTDDLIALNDVHISSQSTAVTIAGTLQDSNFIQFQVGRDVADNLSGDVRLLGVVIEFTIDSAVSA